MTDVIASSQALMDAADELNDLSQRLFRIETRLAPLEIELTEHIENYKAALWDAHVNEDAKHPPEETRHALAVRDFDKAKYGEILKLRRVRVMDKARLSDLREIVAAHRSIVSAAKTELEASEGPQPQWSG